MDLPRCAETLQVLVMYVTKEQTTLKLSKSTPATRIHQFSPCFISKKQITGNGQISRFRHSFMQKDKVIKNQIYDCSSLKRLVLKYSKRKKETQEKKISDPKESLIYFH